MPPRHAVVRPLLIWYGHLGRLYIPIAAVCPIFLFWRSIAPVVTKCHTRRRISLTMRILLACLFLSAQLPAQPPVPRYEVKRSAGRVIIDGKLDEKAWAAAPTIEFIFPWDFQTGAKQKTTAKILWDDDY